MRIIEEYLKLNYLSEVKYPDDDGCYNPHHSITKECNKDASSVRCVAKSNNGISLNDILIV